MQNVCSLYAKEHVLKDNGCGHPPIPIGKLSNWHVRPLCAHVLVGCYDDKEVIDGDVHNGTTKRWDCSGTRNFIDYWRVVVYKI